jgi:hypothetical protein
MKTKSFLKIVLAFAIFLTSCNKEEEVKASSDSMQSKEASCIIHHTTNYVDCELPVEYRIQCSNGSRFRHPTTLQPGSLSFPFTYFVEDDDYCGDCWISEIIVYNCDGTLVGSVQLGECITIPRSSCCGVDRCFCFNTPTDSKVHEGPCE